MLPFFIETRFRLILGWYFTSGYSIDDAVDRVADVLSGCDQQAGSDKDEDGSFVVKTEHVIVDPHLVQVREPTNLTEEPQHDVALAGSSVEASTNSSRVFVLVFLKTDQRWNWRDKFTLPQPSQLRAWEARWLGRQTDKEIEREGRRDVCVQCGLTSTHPKNVFRCTTNECWTILGGWINFQFHFVAGTCSLQMRRSSKMLILSFLHFVRHLTSPSKSTHTKEKHFPEIKCTAD